MLKLILYSFTKWHKIFFFKVVIWKSINSSKFASLQKRKNALIIEMHYKSNYITLILFMNHFCVFCWSEMISKQLSEGGLGFVDLATTPFNILNYLHLYIDIVWRYFLQVKCRKNPHTTKTVCWYSYKNVLKQFIHTVSSSKNTVSFY